jgi:competence protein ComEA
MNFTIAVFILYVLLLAACASSGGRTDAPAAANRNGMASAGVAAHQPCVNLNRATAEELTQLPGVGEVMSQRIIAYREQHGPFRRPAEVIIVEGFSEKKYRAIADRVCAE